MTAIGNIGPPPLRRGVGSSRLQLGMKSAPGNFFYRLLLLYSRSL